MLFDELERKRLAAFRALPRSRQLQQAAALEDLADERSPEPARAASGVELVERERSAALDRAFQSEEAVLDIDLRVAARETAVLPIEVHADLVLPSQPADERLAEYRGERGQLGLKEVAPRLDAECHREDQQHALHSVPLGRRCKINKSNKVTTTRNYRSRMRVKVRVFLVQPVKQVF